jgi:hypothetical protein
MVKDTLPRAKIQALEQFLKERQAEGQGHEQLKGNRIPPSYLVELDAHFDHSCFTSDSEYCSQYCSKRSPTP